MYEQLQPIKQEFPLIQVSLLEAKWLPETDKKLLRDILKRVVDLPEQRG